MESKYDLRLCFAVLASYLIILHIMNQHFTLCEAMFERKATLPVEIKIQLRVSVISEGGDGSVNGT